MTRNARRFAVVSTVLLLSSLVAALIVSAATPREMRVACAAKKSGVMRYVAKASNCTRRERVVRFSRSGARVAACVVTKRRRGLPVGAVRRASRCARPRERRIRLPAPVATLFCAKRRGGRLRSVRRASCRKGEFVVVVSPRNRAPVAVDDSAATDEDTLKVVPVLGNDTDADGDPLSPGSLDAAGATGAAAIDGSGVRYDPRGRFDALAAGATVTDRFRYTATDGRASSGSATVAVTVTGVNDAPAVAGVEAANLDYATDAAAVVVSPAVTVSDVDDASLRGATVRIASGLDSAHDELQFADQNGITGTYDSGTGVLTLTGAAPKDDYQAALRSVSFHSGAGAAGGTRQVSFQVEDASNQSNTATRGVRVNGAPTDLALTHSKIDTTEPSGAVVGNLVTTDPDAADSFTYALVAGAGSGDNDKFQVDGSALETATTIPAGTYSVRLRTDDGHGGSFEKALAVEVVAANGDPTDIALSNATVDENQPAGTTVGNLTTTDPDGADTHTYTLVAGAGSTDNGKFQITGSTLKTAAAVDFEAQPSYSVRIRTNDGRFAGNFEKQFTISANNLNEAPTDIALSASSIAENQGNATVGAFSTTDPDAGNTHTYTLVAGAGSTDNGQFAVTGSTLKTAAGPGLNFETKSSYSIRVRTTDNGVPAPAQQFEKTFTITATDVNDPPAPDNETLATTDRAVPNTTLVFDDPSDGAPDPAGPQKTISGDLMVGDTDEDQPPQTLTMQDELKPTADGGSVQIAADGDFVYSPKAGTSCSDNQDSFTYSLSDGTATSQGTVTVNLISACPWYVDAAAAGGGNGTSASPYNTLAGVSTGGDLDGPGDLLFLYPGAYAGGLTLENNQALQSKRHGLSVPDGSGGAGTTLLEAANAAGPNSTITGGLVLASGNSAQGIHLGDNAAGAALSGTNVGTAVVNAGTGSTSGAIANNSGGAINISGGTLNMAFTTLSASGGAGDGVRLDNARGTVTAPGGTIQNAGDQDVDISGTNTNDDVDFTYGGNVTDSAGQLISIVGQSGGTKDFNGSVNSTGGGVSLSSNTGATVRLDGGLTLSSGTAGALSATGGGTLAVTGAANTLATTTGTALNVANTTIHDDDLTFRSVAASDPATSGIALNTTSNANGRLVVTGNSAGVCGGNVVTANAGGFTNPTVTNPNTGDCTGGTIASAGTMGVSLASVPGGVSLTRMRVNGAADDGINASSVGNGIVLDHVLVDGNGDAAADRGIEFTSVTGTSSITQSSVTGSADDNANWQNNGTSTLALTVANSRFADNSATTGADGIQFRGGTGNPTMTASIHDNAFVHNRDDGFQMTTTTPSTAQMNVTFSDNDIVQGVNNVPNNAAMQLGPGSDSDSKFKMDNNDITGSLGSAVILNPGPDSTSSASFDGIVTGNVIGTGLVDSGSVSGIGIWGRAAGNGVNRFEIRNNQIQNYQSQGMYLRGNEGNGQQTSYTVTGNTIGTQDGNALVVLLEAGSVAGDATTVCADFGGAGVLANTVFDRPAASDIGTARDIATSTLNLVNYGGGSLTTYFTGRNNPGTLTAVQSGSAPGNAGGSCALPATPPLP